MKPTMLGNFRDKEYEGLVQVFRNIPRQNVKSKVYHLHTGGFLDVMKTRLKDTLVSLYTPLRFNTLKNLKNNITQLLFFRKGKPTHDIIKNIIFSSISGIIPLWFKRAVLSKSKMVIVPLECMKYGLKNVKVIPFGIDTEKFRPKKNKNKKPVVAFIGHMDVNKGFMKVIDFFNKTKLDIEKRMYFSSTDPNIQKYIKADIKLMGFQKDMVKAYNDVDVVLVPHQTANASIAIPFVLIEAMACEKKIVTTRMENIVEIAGDTVFYSDFSPKKLENQLRRILKSKNKRPRARIVKRFNLKKMKDDYKRLYDDL